MTDEVKCPECQGPMLRRKSAHGAFFGCARFPNCRGTRDVNGESRGEREKKNDDSERRYDKLPSERATRNDKRRWEE